ncbi:cytochrome d ubiquinol oxidase subunit II [Lentzea sp. NEAU-D7]|uniref:cytochrome d ubiquinol oxidase subunit II n=1 Tax=Lentzea sp. NEAU-D7 TaxID=2994667 RepID=UPI00224B25C1|nr:cytochrome d ubiquinol oxidase subunit II [Lentzea sp. NEAU-D7]MCX2948912.1 cytochrome d ubiquinol oxidase subunit II [Lentzea sp. NEAU-D7]
MPSPQRSPRALHPAHAGRVRHDPRGAAFAYRKSVSTLGRRRFFGAAFALSSLLTPFLLGAVVGGVASGRVPPGIAAGDVLASWANPTSLVGGTLAVLVCAYLAAVFLCGDARRDGEDDLADQFRVHALVIAAVAGAVGLGGIAVLRTDAPTLFAGLTGRGLPVVVLSVIAGLAAPGLLLARHYTLARIASAVAVTAILIGWAVGQYPYVLVPSLTVEQAAMGRTTLTALLVALGAGALVLVPSRTYLYVLFQRPRASASEK